MSEWQGSTPSAAVPERFSRDRTKFPRIRLRRPWFCRLETRLMFCCSAIVALSSGMRSATRQAILSDGKCCRALVACSKASAEEPSTIKASKFSPIRIETASERVRAIWFSTPSIISKMVRALSSKTGSEFRIRSRVSTMLAKCEHFQSRKLAGNGLKTLFLSLAPFAPQRRGIIIWRNLVRGAEMHLCHFPQNAGPAFFDQLFRRFLDVLGHAPLQSHFE